MAVFQRPFDPLLVTVSVAGASLPDSHEPGTLTNFARYPKLALRFLVATPSAANLAFSWPAAGAIRLVDLPPAESAALGVSQLAELSPFPFAIAPVLRALGPGHPTFYIGFAGAPLPPQDSAVRVTTLPFNVSRAVIACIFQDRMTLEPWAWIDIIGSALEQAAPADAARWRTLAALFQGRKTLQVRGPAGQPASDQNFLFEYRNTAGTVVRQVAATSDGDGNLGAALFPQPGERADIFWQPQPLAGDEAIPVVALYEPSLAAPSDDTTRSYPGEPALVLSPSFDGGHLQILDLAQWFAPALQSPGNPWPARFRGGSLVEPLVDGIITYTRLIDDMRRASGIHLGGWAFEETRLRPYDPTSSLSALFDSIGRDKFRLLVTKAFQPKVGALDSLGTEALVILFLAILAAEPLIALEKLGNFNDKGMLTWHAAAILVLAIIIATDPNAKLEDKLRNVVEFTNEETRKLIFDVSDGKPPCAFPAPHPAALADNPLSQDISLPGLGTLSHYQELWGVFHQKFQVLAFADGNFAAYLGGLDLRSNRIDAPGHLAPAIRQPNSLSAPAPSPFHDVHARVTGPASFDVIGLFHERYNHALNFSPPGIVNDPLYHPPAVPPPPAFDPPTAPPPPAGQHLARIAQTSFKPAAGRPGFPWAPNGDAPIRETFERAIRSAREYIYIEDQYFTLDDGLITALRQAADNCRRLVITVAAGTPDQLFGDERRFATFDRLSGATGGPGGWGDRMIAGYPYRRSVLPPADRTASLGRGSLLDDINTAAESKIYVGPVPRVPTSTPYFFWVAGELMYATKARSLTSPGGHPSVELEVLRGSLHGTGPAWCEHPRTHKAGAPITFSAPRDIFVHAKLLMVDDVFVAIGSSNWNRRGFYHDGEIDVFAIPDRLKAARNNPALVLRSQLWAEHLGLIPLMGRSLLADPVEAFELFGRTRCQGNRFSEHREFAAPRGDLSALNDVPLFQIIPDSVKTTLIATANSVLATEVHSLWNTLFDPTTGIDPNPQEGPELP